MAERNYRILLVEDDQNFGDVLRSYLEINDYEVELATDGQQGLEQFIKNKDQYDLCIFDVMMPKKDGFELASEIRQFDEKIPIIFLTAKSMKEDVLKGFKIGADDYITKPFNSEELLYRIQAILKRQGNQPKTENIPDDYYFGKFHFHYPTRILTYMPGTPEEHKEKLSPKESHLLQLFAQHLNEVLPRSLALTQIWGEDNYFTARSMDVFITKLRKYLKKDPQLEIINIHGNGFQLIDKANKS